MIRYFVPSFTQLVEVLLAGGAVVTDLDDSVFQFGARRRHVIRSDGQVPREIEVWEEISDAEKRSVHSLIVAACEKAERENRMNWRPDPKPHLWEVIGVWNDLNALLERNGLRPIPSERTTDEIYEWELAARLVCEVNPDLMALT